MAEICIKARAKINLTLDVLGKRPDGFHEVEMVMQTIDLHDEVAIEEKGMGIEVVTDHPLLNDGFGNIAYKAAKLVTDEFEIDRGIRIQINKRIPVAAGLAGGSSDAAAVIKGLNELWSLGLDYEKMAALGAVLGSDVPFCIRGGTALATGRGETTSPLPGEPDMFLILAKPDIEVSTAEIYKNFVPDRVMERPNTAAMIKGIQMGDKAAIINNLVNVLESVTLERYPEVRALKDKMFELGVERPLMSGSGPSVFGIVDGKESAERISKGLRKERPDLFVTIARSCPSTEGI